LEYLPSTGTELGTRSGGRDTGADGPDDDERDDDPSMSTNRRPWWRG
jgi:hypothetical protein